MPRKAEEIYAEMVAQVGEPEGMPLKSGKRAFSAGQLKAYTAWKKTQKAAARMNVEDVQEAVVVAAAAQVAEVAEEAGAAGGAAPDAAIDMLAGLMGGLGIADPAAPAAPTVNALANALAKMGFGSGGRRRIRKSRKSKRKSRKGKSKSRKGSRRH